MSGDNMAKSILEKLKGLTANLTKGINANREYIDSMFLKIAELNEGSQEKKKVEGELEKLKSQLETLEESSKQTTKEKVDLEIQLKTLGAINKEVEVLNTHVKTLTKNNEQITSALKGGFQYKKTHPKYKGQSRSLHSNSKTTSRKRKKWRRRPGKSVKKGGMKTRRRRRNKKSKKSKKRRK